MGEPLRLDDFLRRVGPVIGRGEAPDPDSLLMADLGLDLGETFALAIELERIRPGFSMPFQMGFDDVRLRDVHHYLVLPPSD